MNLLLLSYSFCEKSKLYMQTDATHYLYEIDRHSPGGYL